MLFQRVNRSDPEKIYVVAKNGSGATLTAGYQAFWDCEMTTPDGVQVTNSATSTTLCTFAGIADAAIANGSYGLLQVWGYRADVYMVSSEGSSAKGDVLICSATPISNGLHPAATSGTVKGYGILMEAIAASGSSSQYWVSPACFIRAL